MIKAIIENGREYNLNMEMFIVFLQAFKTIKRDCTVKTLTELKVPTSKVCKTCTNDNEEQKS